MTDFHDLIDTDDAVDDEVLAQLRSNLIAVDHHGRDAQFRSQFGAPRRQEL